MPQAIFGAGTLSLTGSVMLAQQPQTVHATGSAGPVVLISPVYLTLPIASRVILSLPVSISITLALPVSSSVTLRLPSP